MNLLSIDLEDWYHLLFWDRIKNNNLKNPDTSILYESTLIILKLLKQSNIKAVFFVLGSIAKRFPELVNNISKEGHTIACHGFSHKPVYEMSQKEFRDDLLKATKAITLACGKRPIGYRAPGFSITKNTYWVFDILREEDYKFDSSLFIKNIDESLNVSVYPFVHKNGLVEFPINSLKIGINNLFGGIALRTIPVHILNYYIKIKNLHHISCNILIHPRDFDCHIPKLRMGLINNLKVYGFRSNFEKKIKRLISCNQWASIDEYLIMLNR